MNTNEFIQSLKEETVEKLLEILDSGQIGGQKLDPDCLKAILDELNSRKLSETVATVKDDNREPGRYTALKAVAVLISIFGYIVIILGIIALIFLGSEGQVPFGIAALVISVVIALPLIAYSNLIYVYIDIEYNTRKTKEAIEKIRK
ncbi:hypothetical protein FACS1894201_11210 [Bacteroidia bacterium]|nr:hypothetical protein FACS1894201_11210 [Bacteroidia bacterium]